jgi:hypothetical protein
MKKLAVLALIAGLLALPTWLWAKSARGGGTVNRQTFSWTNEKTTTTRSHFTRVKGLKSVVAHCPRGPVGLTLSADLAQDSAPAHVRVAYADPNVGCSPACAVPAMRPGAVRFGPRANSFTFFLGDDPSPHGSGYYMQWRSPTGGEVKLNKASMHLLWNAPERGTCR